MEWFCIDTVHRSVLDRYRGIGRLYLDRDDVVVHIVGGGSDIYGVEGIAIEVLEEFFSGLISFRRCDLDTVSGYLLFFRSISIELETTVVWPRCRVLYAVGGSESFGKHKLGIAALCRDRRVVEGLAKLLGADSYRYVEDIDSDILRDYLRGCPEIDRSTLIRMLKPVKGKISTVPLSTDHSDSYSEGLYLGYRLDPLLRRRERIYLPHTLGHTLIVGATGSGKSTTLQRLVYEISKHRPVLLLDWVGEHSEAMKGIAKIYRLGIDIAIPLREEREDTEYFIDRLSYYIESLWNMQLSPLQRRILLSTASKIENLSIDTLIISMKKWLESDRRDYKQSADALISRLSILLPLRNIFNPYKPKLEIPSKGITVIDLSSIEPAYLKKIAIHALLYTILKKMKRNRKSLSIAIDEAHNVLDNDRRNIVIEAFLEYRKFGIEMILATSSFTEIPKSIVENTSTIIVHRVPSLRQAEILADLFGANYREKEMWIETLKNMRTGVTAILSRYSIHPILIEIEPIQPVDG
ncbi:MAG TPA: DUF87 domain-containing protein [Ignisphaera sp.]|nr:DUF87 domain-containing protein [Ignisphaera sp.]